MNWVDIVILVVWGVSILWGFSAGLIQMVVPFVALLASLALSSRIGDSVGNVFSSVTDNENAQTAAGFILIFVILFVAGGIIGFLIRGVLGFIPLFGLANRFAGMAAGILIGFVLLSGILTGLQKFPFEDSDKKIDESALGTFLADNFDVVIRGVGLIPGDWDTELKDLAN
ncbi:MAG: hypothetical protein BZY88_17085 [SAR202 cluster bacterium Io17-Chloro-G9]|nr:MAG: hypothetical protein BZY88_17085 [SAR202 cluster bacterium Io17-Chloro-G9]